MLKLYYSLKEKLAKSGSYHLDFSVHLVHQGGCKTYHGCVLHRSAFDIRVDLQSVLGSSSRSRTAAVVICRSSEATRRGRQELDQFAVPPRKIFRI